MIIKSLLKLCFEAKLNGIFNENQNLVLSIFENFFYSLKKFNFFLKFLIVFFLFIATLINFVFIILFFFKFRINYYSESVKILSRLPYFKNINNFIIANLLLHYE